MNDLEQYKNILDTSENMHNQLDTVFNSGSDGAARFRTLDTVSSFSGVTGAASWLMLATGEGAIAAAGIGMILGLMGAIVSNLEGVGILTLVGRPIFLLSKKIQSKDVVRRGLGVINKNNDKNEFLANSLGAREDLTAQDVATLSYLYKLQVHWSYLENTKAGSSERVMLKTIAEKIMITKDRFDKTRHNSAELMMAFDTAFSQLGQHLHLDSEFLNLTLNHYTATKRALPQGFWSVLDKSIDKIKQSVNDSKERIIVSTIRQVVSHLMEQKGSILTPADVRPLLPIMQKFLSHEEFKRQLGRIEMSFSQDFFKKCLSDVYVENKKKQLDLGVAELKNSIDINSSNIDATASSKDNFTALEVRADVKNFASFLKLTNSWVMLEKIKNSNKPSGSDLEQFSTMFSDITLCINSIEKNLEKLSTEQKVNYDILISKNVQELISIWESSNDIAHERAIKQNVLMSMNHILTQLQEMSSCISNMALVKSIESTRYQEKKAMSMGRG